MLRENYVFSVDEINELVLQLRKVYDVVRIVDAGKQRIIKYDDNGMHIDEHEACYKVWGKSSRCVNCVSAMAFREKKRLSKFEFIGHDIYHVTSQYVEVDGNPCLLEIVEKDKDYTLNGALGTDAFITRLQNFAEELYRDSLTDVYNRKYYDDQISGLPMDAVAMIDVDIFKEVNDTYGHLVGDAVLKTVAKKLMENVRSTDSVIRYGGDEFMIVFTGMKEEGLFNCLDKIRKAVENTTIEESPNLHITISIGGFVGKDTTSTLMKRADEALYEAKEKRNTVVIHSQYN